MLRHVLLRRFAGHAQLLSRTAGDADPPQELVATLARHLGGDAADARAFLPALELPEDLVPRLSEIRDVAIERVRELLRVHSRVDTHAVECYEALLTRIEQASRFRIEQASRFRSKGGGPRG